ncbi:MAG: hypothetical protein GC158_03965 [Cyanobacteria bacterium RI_101]|nr:hypothetical protein [Cyanobacteria bacterium RI_101]
MTDLFYRTEDIKPEEVLSYFVETQQDQEIVNALKARNPVILVGSRGVGKSFLLRVAEAKLLASFKSERIFPIYVTFTKSSLVQTSNPIQFQHWMLAKICARITRALSKSGILSGMTSSLSILTGGNTDLSLKNKTKIEKIAEAFEDSWQVPEVTVNIDGLPTVEQFKDAIEDLSASFNISRFAIFIDEAAHIFLPSQQRQFFTLFRDLRSPYITCNAAVYPGVTFYGETFQPIHDATIMPIDRDILSSSYILNMREIVQKQADSSLIANITRNAENFAILAYASNGNPRILLKTLARTPRVNSQEINEVIREYYRNDIWGEHSLLSEKYVGHKSMIDWGRKFIENVVLPELQRKNAQYLSEDKKSTSFFWIHRDAPQAVKEALRLLAYTGIVTEHATGIKATRSEVGTRYMVSLGCLFAQESVPTTSAFVIAKSITIKRMSEYGVNYPSYRDLLDTTPNFSEPNMLEILQRQLSKSIDVLELTDWQKEKLLSLNLNTIGDVLRSTETKLQEIKFIGEKRSRRMRNAAIAAVNEYLSG